MQRAGRFDFDAIERVFEEMEREAIAWLDGEGVPEHGRMIVRKASMHYAHQGSELSVPWPGGKRGEAALADAIDAFHRLHESLYTFAQHDMPVAGCLRLWNQDARSPSACTGRLSAATAPSTAARAVAIAAGLVAARGGPTGTAQLNAS